MHETPTLSAKTIILLHGLAILMLLAGCGGSDNPPPSYTVGGSVTGLAAPGLVLSNGNDSLALAVGASAFVFATPLVNGSTYDVSIKTQPNGQTCSISPGSGVLSGANVTAIAVMCLSPWVWQGGSQSQNVAPVYGTLGVATASTTPGSRTGASSWTDASGNLWLFGGATVNGSAADLWRFVPATGLWTWIGGPSGINTQGVYGTQGMASASNLPGARADAMSWTDATGNFWMFGGGGYALTGNGLLNDLWRYSPVTGQWTWVGGSAAANASGSYGTQGVAAASNLPPGRTGAATWTDASGNLWLFGGLTNDSASSTETGLLNDLWVYDLQSAQWTWVSGSNVPTPGGTNTGVYGTQGTPAAGNVPPVRDNAAAWRDVQGNLWLFGGSFFLVGTGTPFLNDLWMFSPTTRLWTWVGGSQPANASLGSTQGTQGTPAAANVPGIRSGSGAWTDASGKFWLFGGETPGSNLDICCTVSNDLWSYDPTTGLWTWVSGSVWNGSSAVGSYGVQGEAGVQNAPPGRQSPITFLDSNGNLWLFGGLGWPDAPYSDLWEYTILPSTP